MGAPVHDGVKVELGRDAWLAALEAVTNPQIQSPPSKCGVPQTTDFGGGGGGGFSCFGSTSTTVADMAPLPSTQDASAAKSSEDVTVVTQETVGPYEAVVLRATKGDAIDKWLLANHFAIPDSIAPMLTQYTKEGFDFLALKLRPNVGVAAMRPVRIRTPGADATLPLRMVAAGVGQNVALELFVVGEGRWEAKTFDNATINDTKLVWDGRQSRSNYTTLFDQLTSSKPLWVTEGASPTPFRASSKQIFGGTSTLENAYLQTCQGRYEMAPCDPPDGGGPDASMVDASSSDASDPDASMLDAASAPDAFSVDAGECTRMVASCDLFDDYQVATANLHLGSAWVVRLRTTLPASALATDLVLSPEASQRAIERLHVATSFAPGTDPCPPQATPTQPAAS